VNGAFFQFLGRFQVTIQKYGFSHVSETDVVEMKIRFGIFYHYWITLRESQTISLVHFVIGLKPFSRTVYNVEFIFLQKCNITGRFWLSPSSDIQ
jgi:hypothetical protein